MQHRSEETRSKILNAATRLFSQYGYDATGVADICSAAGVSKGAFYHHFPSKQAMFLALLHTWLDGLNRQFTAARSESGSVPQALMDMSSMASSVFQDAQGRLPMIIEFWVQAARDPAVWHETVEPYRLYERFFTALIKQGIQEGSLKDIHPETAARSIVALAMGMLLQGMMDPSAARWDEMLIQGMNMFLEGLVKPAA